MNSSGLTREQLARLSQSVGVHLRYLNRLQRRMDEVGFTPEDALYRAATEARDALAGLFISIHYCTCESGVGKPAAPGGGVVVPAPECDTTVLLTDGPRKG